MCMGSASIICCPYSAALVLNQKSPGQESMHRMQTAPAQTSPSTRKSLVKLFYAISVLSVLSVMSIGFDDQMWLANTKPSLCNFRGGEGHDGPARAIWVRRCEMDLGFSSVCSSKILLLFSYVTALQPVSLNSQELCMCVYYIYMHIDIHTHMCITHEVCPCAPAKFRRVCQLQQISGQLSVSNQTDCEFSCCETKQYNSVTTCYNKFFLLRWSDRLLFTCTLWYLWQDHLICKHSRYRVGT